MPSFCPPSPPKPISRRLGIAGLLLVCSACSTSPDKPQSSRDEWLIKNATDLVVDQSHDKRPGWLEGAPSFEKDGYLYFVSEGADTDGYTLAARISKASAAQELAEQVSLKTKSELARGVQRHGLNVGGQFIQDVTAMTSESVVVQDFGASDTYKEKRIQRPTGQIRYHYFALYRLPLSEYHAAKARALAKMQGRAATIQDVQAEQAAKVLLNDMKQEGQL